MSPPNQADAVSETNVSERTSSTRRRIAGAAAFAVVVTTCAVVFAEASTHSKARHYRKHMDAESLFATLHNEIRAGDSIQRVETLLGKRQISRSHERLLIMARNKAQLSPRKHPSGVRNDDEFVGFCYGNTAAIFLQFREGRLINFDPEGFEATSIRAGTTLMTQNTQ